MLKILPFSFLHSRHLSDSLAKTLFRCFSSADVHDLVHAYPSSLTAHPPHLLGCPLLYCDNHLSPDQQCAASYSVLLHSCSFCPKDLLYSCSEWLIPILHSKLSLRASLVAQWLRVCLPMQGTRVRALVWEDPTCRGATGPVSHNY